jgi:hypothetical protein
MLTERITCYKHFKINGSLELTDNKKKGKATHTLWLDLVIYVSFNTNHKCSLLMNKPHIECFSCEGKIPMDERTQNAMGCFAYSSAIKIEGLKLQNLHTMPRM